MFARNFMKSAVVDTNVFVSALAGSRTCKRIIDLFRADTFELVISIDLISEIAAVLARPKFDFDQSNIEKILRFLKYKATKVSVTEKISVCRDPADNIILECAVSGKADFIVTGDKDLLTLKSFRKIPIVTPRKFLEIIS